MSGGVTRHPDQMPCWITYLDAPGKKIIEDNIGLSAMYGGAITARGPRYCPSVEDKVVRFPEAERHQLFLEPEGHDTTELYVNGLSTSLPAPVQLEVMRSVPGLESVRMNRAGYAIEYDYYPPTQLDSTLQVKSVRRLFFAGQINGTTGYEEAAGQGVLAGINAGCAALGNEGLILGRETSYIGVLVDDLVTCGVDEPYRLFTSRSEFRLTVRQDNAIQRLGGIATGLGLYSNDEREIVEARQREEGEIKDLAERTSITPAQAAPLLARVNSAALPHSAKIAEVARRHGVSLVDLFQASGISSQFSSESLLSSELGIKYAGYFAREKAQADRMKSMGDFVLPSDVGYTDMSSLSYEARQKLTTIRPRTLAQASRIPGVSPSDIQNLVIEVEKKRARAGSH